MSPKLQKQHSIVQHVIVCVCGRLNLNLSHELPILASQSLFSAVNYSNTQEYKMEIYIVNFGKLTRHALVTHAAVSCFIQCQHFF